MSDPYFPDLDDAAEANRAALEGWGQTNHALLRPEVLESALGRAANHYHYGTGSHEERMADAAGALAHGVGSAQAFEDGNKRTSYWLTHYFAHQNQMPHLVPDDDEELADHLIGHGEGTHSLQDTQNLFRSRQGVGPTTSAKLADESPAGLGPDDVIRHMRGLHKGFRGRSKGDNDLWWERVERRVRQYPQWARVDHPVQDIPGVGSFDTDKDRTGEIEAIPGQMPPIVIDPEGVVDGWHRSSVAYRRGDSHIPAYVVQGDVTTPANGQYDNQRGANILDKVHPGLDPSVWDNPEAPDPILKPQHRHWLITTINAALEKHGYDGMDEWLTLVLTGSLTTYQYSEHSDCDVSLWVDAPKFPEWSRGEMIGIMIEEFDDVVLPGTTHPLQAFVVASKKLTKNDLYKPGLRSGYDLLTQHWITPPEKSRSHDVEHEMNADYTYALEVADKMERLLRYEPDKAVKYYAMIHKRRMRDQTAGKGDYSQANVIYKMLDNRGLFDQLKQLGVHIA